MAKLYAYALHTVHLPPATEGGEIVVVSASTANHASVFETNPTQFAQLDKLGAARAATDDEITVYLAGIAKANGHAVTETATAPVETDQSTTAATNESEPEKTADKDPAAKPKSAKKANSDDVI